MISKFIYDKWCLGCKSTAQHRTMVKNTKSLGNKFHRKWFQENCSVHRTLLLPKLYSLWFCCSLGHSPKKSSFISEPNFFKAKKFVFITLANSGENRLPSIQQEELNFFIHQTKKDREYDVYCKPPVQLVGMAVLCRFSMAVLHEILCHSAFCAKYFLLMGRFNKISCDKLVRCRFFCASFGKQALS